jgi:hypothetical protein
LAPETAVPVPKDTECVDPREEVPDETTRKKPIIVIASKPPPQERDKLDWDGVQKWIAERKEQEIEVEQVTDTQIRFRALLKVGVGNVSEDVIEIIIKHYPESLGLVNNAD